MAHATTRVFLRGCRGVGRNCPSATPMRIVSGHDCEGPDAMLNFARHVFGYARYCPKMNAWRSLFPV
jgi:hypothetical protein